MALPEDERAELAAILVDSIGDGRSETEVDAAWLAEAKRRLEAVRSGQATLVPTEEVERELEDLLLDAPETRRAG
jgi:putative addiction module component (TIGR02574 family)